MKRHCAESCTFHGVSHVTRRLCRHIGLTEPLRQVLPNKPAQSKLGALRKGEEALCCSKGPERLALSAPHPPNSCSRWFTCRSSPETNAVPVLTSLCEM